LICPKCRGNTFVTRTIEKNSFTSRYRKCKKCNHTFKTRELITSNLIYEELVKKIKKLLEDIDV
jgi:transcriptional regulator NrdR family protein